MIKCSFYVLTYLLKYNFLKNHIFLNTYTGTHLPTSNILMKKLI